MSSHIPDSLLKHCDLVTGLEALKTRRLRWCAPHLLGDPFALDAHSQLSFDPERLLQSVVNHTTAMIFAADPPRGNTSLLQAIRRWRDEERFASPEEAESVMEELLGRMVSQRLEEIEKTMQDWRSYSRNLRICSLTARPTNLYAWEYQAQRHRGIAIRLQTGVGTSLGLPHKVLYQQSRPQITHLQDEINAVLNNTQHTPQKNFHEKFLCKGPHQSQQQEWRCFKHVEVDKGAPLRADEEHYDHFAFECGEVEAIYLGIALKPEERHQLLEVVRQEYRHAKIFEARFVGQKYELDFDRLRLNKSV